MKLHDLRPAAGSRSPKQRVGRGIAAGGGKTAGRGTKGQKSRAGGTLPAWFEGGQTPLHQRIPKLRGFRNPMKVEYEVVNVGAIARLVDLGTLETGEEPAAKPAGRKAASSAAAAPITVNQEILRAAGLVRTLDKPLKVLGNGELTAALFVVADAFSASARTKIEAAGGGVSVLEVPTRPSRALKLEPEVAEPPAPDTAPEPTPDAAPKPVREATPKRARNAAPRDAAPKDAAPKDAAAKDAAPKDAAPKRARSKSVAAEPERLTESKPSDAEDAAAIVDPGPESASPEPEGDPQP